jgi:hypothetical protein
VVRWPDRGEAGGHPGQLFNASVFELVNLSCRQFLRV